MTRVCGVILCAMVTCLSAGRALAAPGMPSVSMSWELTFEFHDPQRITLTLPGEMQPITYWYLLFKVTNETGSEVEFYPSFRLVTDTLQVVEGGANVNPAVYDAIAERHKGQYPFFAPPTEITGTLLQGEENARVSAAVFRMFDPTAARFTVYISGLSGDIDRIPNPATKPANPGSSDAPRFFLLRRTLAITYDLPGDVHTRLEATPIRRSRTWVMR